MTDPAPENTTGAGARGKVKIGSAITAAIAVGGLVPDASALIRYAVGTSLCAGAATLALRLALQRYLFAHPTSKHPPPQGTGRRQRRTRASARRRLKRLMRVEAVNIVLAGVLGTAILNSVWPSVLYALGLVVLTLEVPILGRLFAKHARTAVLGHVQTTTAAFRASRGHEALTETFDSLSESSTSNYLRDHSPWRLPASEKAASVFAASMVTVTFWTAVGLDTAAVAATPPVRHVVIAIKDGKGGDEKPNTDTKPDTSPGPSPSATSSPMAAPKQYYRTDCAAVGIPGHDLTDRQAARRLDALYEGDKNLKINGQGAREAGCGDGGHAVPAPVSNAYYSIGRCGSTVRSLAVTGTTGTGMLLHDAARYGLGLATTGKLTGVDPLYKVGTGDAYVLHTLDGDRVLARRGYTSPTQNASAQPVPPCRGVSYAAQGYVAVFGAATTGWMLIAQLGGRLWPVPDTTAPAGAPAWIFFSNDRPDEIVGRIDCTDAQASTCTVTITGGAVVRVTGRSSSARDLFQ